MKYSPKFYSDRPLHGFGDKFRMPKASNAVRAKVNAWCAQRYEQRQHAAEAAAAIEAADPAIAQAAQERRAKAEPQAASGSGASSEHSPSSGQ
jgi:hypothetical protein